MIRELFLLKFVSPTGEFSSFFVNQKLEKSRLTITKIHYDHNDFIVKKTVNYKVFAVMMDDETQTEFLWQDFENCNNIHKIYPFPNLKPNEMLLSMIDENESNRN